MTNEWPPSPNKPMLAFGPQMKNPMWMDWFGRQWKRKKMTMHSNKIQNHQRFKFSVLHDSSWEFKHFEMIFHHLMHEIERHNELQYFHMKSWMNSDEFRFEFIFGISLHKMHFILALSFRCNNQQKVNIIYRIFHWIR